MKQALRSVVSRVLQESDRTLLDAWMKEQLSSVDRRADMIPEEQLREDSRRLLQPLARAAAKGVDRFEDPAWDEVRGMLEDLSRTRALKGFKPTETATFVLSLKQVLFLRLKEELSDNPTALSDEIWAASLLLDKLAMFTISAYLKVREQVILQQQNELLELSTPVVELWKGVLGLPLIGTLDSARTQIVMESLLTKIVETGSSIAIIDITGVPTVDTLVAQHLLKTISAARLMGADCIISGIRPQIAQTIVHLGVDLGEVTTKATLAAALELAMRRIGATVNTSAAKG